MSKKNNKDTSVWIPKGFDLKKSYALQALIDGKADEHQQKEAILYIINGLCCMSTPPEDLDNVNSSYYNMGRQSVGRAINQIAKFNLAKIKDMEKKR